MRTLLALAFLLPIVSGCRESTAQPTPAKSETAKPETAKPPTVESAAASAAGAAPAGAPAPVPAPKIHTLDFQAQSGWVQEEPGSAMRAAQYLLPRVEGDDRDASLVVFYFGAQGGGTIESNVDRWLGQLEQPDGTPTRDRAKIEVLSLGAYVAHRVDATGTYVAETRPGSGEHLNQPGTRMIALVIDTPAGAYYPKLIGPEKTVAHWAASFDAFLQQATK